LFFKNSNKNEDDSIAFDFTKETDNDEARDENCHSVNDLNY
jgi:hypothetical protein